MWFFSVNFMIVILVRSTARIFVNIFEDSQRNSFYASAFHGTESLISVTFPCGRSAC